MEAASESLNRLEIILPAAPAPVASYVPAVSTGSLVVVSGQIPMKEGVLIATGRVPSEVSVQEAQVAARQCALNALAVLEAEVEGGIDAITRIVRVGVFVASDPGFTDQPVIANGASDLLAEVFGERGHHARAAVGSVALPLNATVEVEMMVEVGEGPAN